MKILSKREVNNIIARISAIQIIVNNEFNSLESLSKLTENLADITFTIGGSKACDKVWETVTNWRD